MKEFWTELVTKESWEKLKQLPKEIDFVLIGGWAAYLWTKKHKSKDIDIIVDFKNLEKLKQKYDLNKNVDLRKYEIKFDKFDIDVYVPFFSRLKIPCKDLLKEYTFIENIKVIKMAPLIVLKQAACEDRKGSVKGQKDEIDLITLLYYVDVDWSEYRDLLRKYELEDYAQKLVSLIHSFDAIDYLGVEFKQYVAWKKGILKVLMKM